MNYQQTYNDSMARPEDFWAHAATAIDWIQPWDSVVDDSGAPFYQWFPGARLNTCYNALDRHIDNGRGEQTALIYDSPVTDSKQKFSFAQLRDEVALVAGALTSMGVGKGDRVVIYMPMIPQTVMAMLACARIGAIHSVVFGGFASAQLAERIDDAQPKVILSASCGIEVNRLIHYKPLLDAAIELAAHKPEHCLIYQRPQLQADMSKPRDMDWQQACAQAQPADCVSVAATDPLYILYTSGTTGKPKGVVRDNGGHAVAMLWSIRHVYNMQAGDVFWAASDVGWVVGHSYIVYAPLLNATTTVLYEGKPVGTPDPGAFWRVIEEYKVNALFTAPTAFRAIKKEDPQGVYIKKYNLQHFHTLFLAGERCDPDTLHWAENLLHVPVIDHWWQTETGWPVASNCLGIEPLAIKPGSPSKAVPGYDIQVLDEQGQASGPDQIGNIVIKLPMPPGCLSTLWNNNQLYIDSYLSRYPGYYLTGDAGYADSDDYLWIMSRIDDVINVAGHRLSTGAFEEVLSAHPDVAECAVIGVADKLKGELPLGLVVLKAGVTQEKELIISQLISRIRDTIGPVAAFKQAVIIERLPKTRSGKILRGTMRSIADGKAYPIPATIDDPLILDEIQSALNKIGYAL